MSEQISNCLNCSNPLSEKDKFCAVCGQNTNAHLLSLSELFSNFWSSLTNLDNSVFNTLKYIWTPWKLTTHYVAGKKKSFLNPVRIFLITLVFHFGLLISAIDLSEVTLSQQLFSNYEKNKLYQVYKGIKKSSDTIECQPIFLKIDTTVFKDAPQLENDTVTKFYFRKTKFAIAGKDVIELPADSIISNYGYTTFLDKLICKQLVRSYKDPDGTIKYVLGNMIWAILLTILMLAGFFKLLYWRKNLTYVEHLIFLLNVHSFAFLLNTAIIFITDNELNKESGELNLDFGFSFIIIPSIIFIISLYKYYQQSFFKTFVKSTLSSGFYLITVFFFMFLTAFVSFLLF